MRQQKYICTKWGLPEVLFFMLPFFWGVYSEYASCVLSVLLFGILWLRKLRRNSASLSINAAFLSGAGICASYGLSAFWAVDKGMAFVGFLKVLPLFLLAILLAQFSKAERDRALQVIPSSAVVMVLLSIVGSVLPVWSRYFVVNGRLAGFFQYPNTFALFLLLGFSLLAVKSQWRWSEWFAASVLLFGIYSSGSRTVFILITAFTIVSCLRRTNNWRNLLVIAGLSFAASLIYVVYTKDVSGIGRYLTISFDSSTFLGRLLYFKDALPVIASHPFGIGYMGYYYSQGAFQRGVYSVTHVHNDVLQILLDAGWLPTALLLWALALSLRSPRTSSMQKTVLILIFLHCLFDFDLQYISIFAILLLCLDWDASPLKIIRVPKPIQTVISVGLIVPSLWVGSSCFTLHIGMPELAVRIFPWNTAASLHLLSAANTVSEMEAVADRILQTNESLSVVWSAKARAAYAQGDFTNVISAKQKALSLAKYSSVEYEDYFQMLVVGRRLYLEAEDSDSAEICLREILDIRTRIENVVLGTDPLAWRLTDTPQLKLPEGYEEYLSIQQNG